MAKKESSYLDTIGSGFESITVKEYDPAVEEGQIGKEHEQEVAPSNNWEDDQRDPIGRAASKRRRLAMKLRRIAREIEAFEMNPDYKEDIADVAEKVEEQATGESVEEGIEQEFTSSAKRDEFIVIEASHPLEHDPAGDDPEANMSSQTGDEQWISIGPGTFDDKRDLIGRAASKNTKK